MEYSQKKEKKDRKNEEKKPRRGGFRDSAECRESHRSQPNFNCLLRKCKRFYWCLKEDGVSERTIVSLFSVQELEDCFDPAGLERSKKHEKDKAGLNFF